MIINKISNTISQPKFNAHFNESVYKFAESKSIKTEFMFRKLANNSIDSIVNLSFFLNKFLKTSELTKEKVNLWIEKVKNVKEDSAERILSSYEISRILCSGKEVEINIENGELQDIANSNEACIFIMNHDKQKDDSKLVSFFNALLCREYLCKNKAATCPRPQIVLNKDILDSSGDTKKLLAEKWGAVGVDAAIHCKNQIFNGRVTAKLVNGLINDKINMFIFPEGRMCAFPNMSPDWKFQSGVADIIRAVARKKDRVKVVPLGFAYNKGTGAIHIGKPLYFKDCKDRMMFTIGTLDEKYSSKEYLDYISNIEAEDNYLPILEQGEFVNPKKSSEYIAGILCDNLVVCKRKANDSIKNVNTINDADTIYSIE